jgi:hypothetical protein
MFAFFLDPIWNGRTPVRLAVFALFLGAALLSLSSGCAAFGNGTKKGGGWSTSKPPKSAQPIETVDDFMRLKRLDP